MGVPPCVYFQPREAGVVFYLSSGLQHPIPPHHLCLHLTHPQASGRGQDTRDSPLAQHKLQCPRPLPHPAICTAILHLLSTLPDVLICVNIYFCV